MDRTRTNQHYDEVLASARENDGLRAAIRHLARTDLFFLLTRMCHRDDVNRDWIFDRIREVEANPDGHLDIWARGHYKSTIITFGLTIQGILVNPEITTGILSHTRPIAKAFLSQIKTELEGNTTLKNYFDDVLWANPKKEASKWGLDDGLIVKRLSNPKESTVEAWGLVDGQPTSKHFNKIAYDDVVTEASVTNPDMMAKTTKAWELSLNLLAEGGVYRGAGTFYHPVDTYHTMIKRGRPVRIYPATSDGKVEGEPVLLTRAEISQKRKEMGPYTFGCQMLCDPKADRVQGFKEDWLRFWPAEKFSYFNLALLIDPADSKGKYSDYTVMWVVGLGEDQNYYVVDGLRAHLNLVQRANAVFDFHLKFAERGNPIRFTGYEKYGLQADVQHIRHLMNERNYRFPIVEMGGNVPKLVRIRTLIPLFEAGRIWLPKKLSYIGPDSVLHNLTREFIDEEYNEFPVCEHDDMLDCLARITDPMFKVRHPKRLRPVKAMTMAEQDWAILEGRDHGFGPGSGLGDCRVMDDLSDADPFEFGGSIN